MKDFNFNNTDQAKIAFSRMSKIPDNFYFYELGYLSFNPNPGDLTEITGAVFREAKSGPRKGQLVIPVKGTDQSFIVSKSDIDKV